MIAQYKVQFREILMENSNLVTFGVNLLFSVIVATSYIMYGLAFNRMGGLPADKSVMAFISYAFAVLINPFFLSGLVLALTGSLVRMALFSLIGISRSALAAELSLILMMVFSAIIFRESPRFPKDYLGGLFILIGSYIVASH